MGDDAHVTALLIQTRTNGRLGIRAYMAQFPDGEHVHKALQIILQKALTASADTSSPPADLGSHDANILKDSIVITVLKTARLVSVLAQRLADVDEFGEVRGL